MLTKGTQSLRKKNPQCLVVEWKLVQFHSQHSYKNLLEKLSTLEGIFSSLNAQGSCIYIYIQPVEINDKKLQNFTKIRFILFYSLNDLFDKTVCILFLTCSFLAETSSCLSDLLIMNPSALGC